MSDFYTLTLRREHVITTYDAKGRRTGEKTSFIEERHHDLPAQTVATYKQKFPNAVVAVERQAWEMSRGTRQSSARTAFADAPKKRQGSSLAASEPRREAMHVPSYADAINAAVAREARA